MLQALGTGEYPLPPGSVCAGCNSYLGGLDRNFCDHHHLAALIVFGQIGGTKGRIRQHVATGLAFDAKQQHLTISANKPSIVDGCLTIRDAGNEQFCDWKFSRGLHRVALGALALSWGVDQALCPRYDAVRRYIRQPKGRREFWPYFQRVSDKVIKVRTYRDALTAHGFKLSFGVSSAATYAYVNFFVSEFVVALDGNIASLTDDDHGRMATAADTPPPHSVRPWLFFDRANAGERIELNPENFRRLTSPGAREAGR